jgi:plastocyanin
MALAGVAAVAAAPAAAGRGHATAAATSKSVKRSITVSDDYYAPAKVTVPRGSTIKWVWPYGNQNTHDVKLAKRPKGAKRFQSEPAAAGFSFSRRLTVPGTYRIVCTLHQAMTMTVVVRR